VKVGKRTNMCRGLGLVNDYLSFTIDKVENPPGLHRVSHYVREKGDLLMLQRFASTAFVVGTLLTASIPSVALAQNHGDRSPGRRSGSSRGSAESNRGRSFAGGSRDYASRGSYGGSRYSGGQSFASPRGYDGRRGYSAGRSYSGGDYAAPRSYRRPIYRGGYGGGAYLGYGAPYGYPYGPGYVYSPGYAYDQGYADAPAPPPPACAGSYDQYGNWLPGLNCDSGQQQYPQPQRSYDPNQQQYPQPQQNYDPNQQQDPQPRQNYDPNQQQYPQPRQNYDPNQQQYPQPPQNYVPNRPPRYNR
jgi:hypothetical protein